MGKQYSNLAVVIPAINELGNLKILVKKVSSGYPGVNIYIVDDSSGKENDKLKKALLPEYKKLLIISRKKKGGRGSAVIRGLREALKKKSIKVFVEMDADLAHDPKEIKLLLEKAKEVDMVIGSRYLSKSNIIDWPLRRVVQSKIINLFLNIWLGLKLSDYTNGFRAYSRNCASVITRAKLYEKGFISLSEIAYILLKKGFEIGEVPISFRDRKLGVSNANYKELLISLIGALRIKFRHG